MEWGQYADQDLSCIEGAFFISLAIQAHIDVYPNGISADSRSLLCKVLMIKSFQVGLPQGRRQILYLVLK
jgi:hypothetical protein